MPQSTTPPNWGRQWTPHNQNGDYVVVDPRVVHYEQHAGPSSAMPRSMMALPYMISPTYSQGQYQSQPPMAYSHYTSSPTSLDSPFHEQLRFPSAESDHSPVTSHQETPRSRSLPSSRTLSTTGDSQSAKQKTKSTSVSVPGISKTVAPIVTVGTRVESKTFVDMLLKTIQAKPETSGIVTKVEEGIKQEYYEARDVKMEDSPSPSPSRTPAASSKQARKLEKKYFCDFSGCIAAFAQRPHLTIHQRTHFGEKPYSCQYCQRKFTQPGNTKAHEATHTKLKSYPCALGCGKWFRSRSTAKQHLKIHSKVKEFVCKLCETEKRFALRGNLKTHLDNFHKVELQELQARVTSASSIDDLPEAERDLFIYFATLFKNCNKGIKGRGKNRDKVQVMATPPATNSSCSSGSSIDMHAAGPMHAPHFHESHHHIRLPVINTSSQHHHPQHNPVHHHHDAHAHGLPLHHHHHNNNNNNTQNPPPFVLPPVYSAGLPPPLVTSISMAPVTTMAYDMHSAGSTPGGAANSEELAFGERVYH